MSTLQISLAVAGAALLAGVVAHSAWSTRKNLPKQATPEKPDAGSSSAATTAGAGATDAGTDALGGRREPTFEMSELDSGLGSLQQLRVMTLPERKSGLDPLIDVMAPVSVDTAVSGEAALAAMPATRRAGSKPLGVEGLNTLSDEWELPAPGGRYSAFQVGVQLANRTGALNEIEFSEFVIKAQAFADAISGEPEFPDMLEEVARARELDQFASSHDAQLGFTLRALNTAWSPGYVQQNAARLGFIPGAMPGRMVLPGTEEGSAPILGLSFDTQAAMADEPEQTALREVTLSLDVPQVARSERPFARMCETAIALARQMDGVITDDNGNPIRPEAMEIINADLEKLYDTLDGRELSAGSPLGRRLFS
ncbi:MAG: cell division protein ZipA C-terminal FtsZ-binding domain-containing protein [Pseudomonadota bacterium]